MTIVVMMVMIAMGKFEKRGGRIWGDGGRQKKRMVVVVSGKGNAFYYCACYFSGSREHWNSRGKAEVSEAGWVWRFSGC